MGCVGRGTYDIDAVVELGIVLVHFFVFFKNEIPKITVSSIYLSTPGFRRGIPPPSQKKKTYLTTSSTPKSFLHFSALSNISLPFTTSNFLALKNLKHKKTQNQYSNPQQKKKSIYLKSAASAILSGTNCPSSTSSFLNFSNACCCATVIFPNRPGRGL